MRLRWGAVHRLCLVGATRLQGDEVELYLEGISTWAPAYKLSRAAPWAAAAAAGQPCDLAEVEALGAERHGLLLDAWVAVQAVARIQHAWEWRHLAARQLLSGVPVAPGALAQLLREMVQPTRVDGFATALELAPLQPGAAAEPGAAAPATQPRQQEQEQGEGQGQQHKQERDRRERAPEAPARAGSSACKSSSGPVQCSERQQLWGTGQAPVEQRRGGNIGGGSKRQQQPESPSGGRSHGGRDPEPGLPPRERHRSPERSDGLPSPSKRRRSPVRGCRSPPPGKRQRSRERGSHAPLPSMRRRSPERRDGSRSKRQRSPERHSASLPPGKRRRSPECHGCSPPQQRGCLEAALSRYELARVPGRSERVPVLFSVAVYGLRPGTAEGDIRAGFDFVRGCIVQLSLCRSRNGHMALLRYDSPRLARRALEDMQGALVNGAAVTVQAERQEARALREWLQRKHSRH